MKILNIAWIFRYEENEKTATTEGKMEKLFTIVCYGNLLLPKPVALATGASSEGRSIFRIVKLNSYNAFLLFDK